MGGGQKQTGGQGLGGRRQMRLRNQPSDGGCRRRRDEIRRGVGAERSALIQAAALVLCWRVRSTHLAPAVHEGGSRGAAEQATRPRALFI